MKQSGHQSAASLATVSSLPSRLLEPVAGLTDEQAVVWMETVATKPADWFDAGSVPLLAAYCRAVVESRKVAALVEAMTSDMLLMDDGLSRYKELRKIQAQLSGEMTTLATKMRLSQQSKMRADHASVLTDRVKGNRPWQEQRHRVIES